MSNLDLSRALVQPPNVPSKYDIIPIHTSDRGTFKNCRRRWDWSSPARKNLVPKATIHGVRIPLWFGTGIHYALQKFYDPAYQEDPTVAFETWFDLQYNGGIVTEAELGEFLDRSPVYEPNLDQTPEGLELDKGGVYIVKGLSDILPDPDFDLFEEHRQLGIGMMNFYKDYAAKEDNFAVISVEHTFSVPILDDNGQPLYMEDTREMPPSWLPNFDLENGYGPLNKWATTYRGGNPGDGPDVYLTKQVHARGRQDVIIQDLDSGRFGIIDFKTAGKINDDYFRHLDLDEQVTTYAWSAEQEAKMYDLPYQQIDYVIYQAMLKAVMRPPTITSRGLPSIDRANESTTAEMFAETIDVLGMRAYYNQDEKMQAYYTWLTEQGDSRFVDRYTVRRNKAQKANCGRRLTLEAQDMLENSVRIYPNPSKDYSCLNCAFRMPCIAAEDGSDWQSILEDGYEVNHDR